MAKSISNKEATKKLGLPENPKKGQSTEKGQPATTKKMTIDEARKAAREADKKNK